MLPKLRAQVSDEREIREAGSGWITSLMYEQAAGSCVDTELRATSDRDDTVLPYFLQQS
jgi:hypothetical protein